MFWRQNGQNMLELYKRPEGEKDAKELQVLSLRNSMSGGAIWWGRESSMSAVKVQTWISLWEMPLEMFSEQLGTTCSTQRFERNKWRIRKSTEKNCSFVHSCHCLLWPHSGSVEHHPCRVVVASSWDWFRTFLWYAKLVFQCLSSF